ncbi:cysteine hydrolase family protein [Pseudomonas solani]|uniref:Cysteine hydrolase family protein n=1 Tax=Pseudomonas solani TaxID=2731552 RepID=A0AAU7YDR1_9PSED
MHDPRKSALLIIDMQVALYEGPDKPWQGELLLTRVNQLIARARAAGAPIFAARFAGPEGSPVAPGSKGWALHPRLEVDPARDRIFDKNRPSCFSGTRLDDWLRDASIGELVVVGMKTQYCIDSTCRAAADLGYRVVLAEDAHSCMDTPALDAAAIIRHHNLTLSGPFARLVKTDDVSFL